MVGARVQVEEVAHVDVRFAEVARCLARLLAGARELVDLGGVGHGGQRGRVGGGGGDVTGASRRRSRTRRSGRGGARGSEGKGRGRRRGRHRGFSQALANS